MDNAESECMTTWIISELYYPEQNATGYFLTGIAESLVYETNKVSVLCAQPSYNQRGVKAALTEVKNGVFIRRCWSTRYDPKIILGRLLNLVTTSASIGWRSMFSLRKGDKVLVVTNPPLLPFLIRVVCWFKRAKFVLLVHDVYPDVLVSLGVLRRENPLFRLMSWFNERLYSSSHAVAVLGRDMARLVEQKSNGRAIVSIIPNWGDVEAIRPTPRMNNPLLRDLNLTDKFVIQYSGNHGRTHDLLSLVEAANNLKNESDIHFLFIGEGSGKSEAVARAAELDLNNISFRTFVDREELNISLNASDISVVAFKSGMAGISVPSRLYNLMAAGKPILAVADAESELAEVVRESGAGVLVSPGSPGELADAILDLKSNAEARKVMGERSRNEVLLNYSYPRIKRQYRQLFDQL